MGSSNNLIFFPIPYHDELMYSILARYHYYTPKTSFQKKQVELFGRKDVRPSLKFASFLKPLCQRMDWAFWPEEFIVDHTVAPYYIHLVGHNCIDGAIRSLLGPSNSLMTILSRRNLASEDRHFRYCPLCAKEDLEQYGETFFHVRSHLDGINVCPKHLVSLLDYPYDSRISLRNRYLIIEPEKLDFTDVRPAGRGEATLALMAQEVLELPLDKYNGVEVRESVIKVLQKNGLMRRTGIKTEEIYRLIEEAFPEILKENNLIIKSFSSYNWLDAYLSRGKTSHPLIPLLIIGLFYSSFDDFIKEAIEGEVYPEVLECHNPFCSNYNNKTSHLVSIDSDYRGGVYRCSCGQIYHSNYSHPEKFTVLDYGKLYVNSLLELRDQGISFDKLAEKVHLSRKGVTKQVQRFKEGYVSIDEKTQKYLEDVINYKEEHPGWEKHNLSSKFQTQYGWFRKYKPEYLAELNTSRKPGNVNIHFKDYRSRDSNYLKQAELLVDEFYSREPPVWVTKRLLIESLKPVPSRYLLTRLTRTRKFIDRHYETRSDFTKRSILEQTESLIKSVPGFNLTPESLSKELKKPLSFIQKYWDEIVTIVTKI